jgi:hypothetical protein
MNRFLAQLTDPNEEIRHEARHELSMRMDDEIAKAFLDVAVSDAPEEIRADAIVGLGPIIDEAGMDYSDDEFELGPELGPGITIETFQSLVAGLRGVYDDEAQPKLVRRRAFEVLVRDPQPWQTPAIRKHFQGDDSLWQLTSVFGMGYVGGFDPEIAATVAKAEGPILYEAVRAAGAMDVAEAAERIRQIATDNKADTELRLAAIEALPNVDDDCDEILETLSASDEEEIAEAAEAALDDLAETRELGDDDFDEGE